MTDFHQDDESSINSDRDLPDSFDDDNYYECDQSTSASRSMVNIVVKRAGAAERDCINVKLDASATVFDLKYQIYNELSRTGQEIPVARQRLIFSGKMLREDHRCLTEDVVRMKVGEPNFVHLAPLPEGAVPSHRTETCEGRKRSANRRGDASRRPHRSEAHVSSRERRRRRRSHHPYAAAPQSPRVRLDLPPDLHVPSASALAEGQGLRVVASPRSFPFSAVPSAIDALAPAASLLAAAGASLSAAALPSIAHPLLPAAQLLSSPVDVVATVPETEASLLDQQIGSMAGEILPLLPYLQARLTQLLQGRLTGSLGLQETLSLLDRISRDSSSLSHSLRLLSAAQATLQAERARAPPPTNTEPTTPLLLTGSGFTLESLLGHLSQL